VSKFAESAVNRLVSSGVVREGNRDIYEYALISLLSTSANLCITFVLGILFGIPLEMAIMVISFFSMRATAGGYHAQTFTACAVASAISVALAFALIKFVPYVALLPLTGFFAISSLIIVFLLVPVSHPNRPIGAEAAQKFRKVSLTLSSLFIVLSSVLCLLKYPRYGFSITVGMMMVAVAMLVSVIRR